MPPSPTGGAAAPSEGFRSMAVAKAASVGRGGFGPEPGTTSQKNLQGKVEARNRGRAEAEQDKRESNGPYRTGSSKPRPIPPSRPGGGVGNKQQHSPYGSNRNYPQYT